VNEFAVLGKLVDKVVFFDRHWFFGLFDSRT
jgi:hypothetical protein